MAYKLTKLCLYLYPELLHLSVVFGSKGERKYHLPDIKTSGSLKTLASKHLYV